MIKVFLLLIIFLSILNAANRPKIALVLSGGGARGGAHVGVLKVLEENHIPIDMIVGTSMGSFVGGLYAAGKTPQEIEAMLVGSEWEHYINVDFNRQNIPMRRKLIDYTYPGRLGLGVNAANQLVLPTGVLKRELLLLKFMEETAQVQDIHNFDELHIPFRAVATNIRNGDAVVLKSGSLAKAIYASSAIPGGLQPININGVDLVDGGVSDNIPIEVAKKMGAEIIIAVDVSEDFADKIDVNSYLVVMGQLVDILMRKNANESIEKLSKKDILITPDLEGYSGLDVSKYAEIIQRGYKAAKKSQENLKQFSLSDKEYAEYKNIYRSKKVYQAPRIDTIEIQNPTYISDKFIRAKIHQQIGKPLDSALLRDDLLSLYNSMNFDSVDYEVISNEGKNSLLIKTIPSWNNHGDIRFSFGLEDDFKGHSYYSLKFGYTMFGINELGGEWKNDFEIGRYQTARTEYFQPLDYLQRYYFKSALSFESVTDIFLLNNSSNQELYSRRYGGSLAFGRYFGNSMELEMAVSKYKDKVKVSSLGVNENYSVIPLDITLNIDSLDNVNFPTEGVRSQLKWTKEMGQWGSDYDYEQIYFDFEKPLKFYANNITFYAKYGNTYARNDNDIVRLSGTFTLGGLFNLSGYVPYSFVGDNLFLSVLKYTYEIKDGGFFGSLNAPLYAGFSLESGRTWDQGEDIWLQNMHKSGTVYVAADTFLGPLYFALGLSEDGQKSAYLYLGEKF